MSRLKTILSLIYCMSLSFSYAEAEFKIITLQHQFAENLLPIISPMVGIDGTATGMNNQLILRASPERMREIEATIQQLDITRVNRRITINTNTSSQRQHNRTEASGGVKIDNITIGNDRKSSKNNNHIILERNHRYTQNNSNQFLNVLDGERAFVQTGQIVPFTQEWITITRRYIQIDRITNWREITTGFAIRPMTIGHQVELEITPRIASLNNQGTIDFEELTTTLRVSLNEWIDIGATMQNHDDISRKILGQSNTTSSQYSSLMIKVD